MNVLPEPLTQRQLAALPPEFQRAYWRALYYAWSRPTYLQRDEQADHHDAVRDRDWGRA